MAEFRRTNAIRHNVSGTRVVPYHAKSPSVYQKLPSLIDLSPSFGPIRKAVQDKAIETDGWLLEGSPSIEGATNAVCDRISCAFNQHIQQMNLLLKNQKHPMYPEMRLV